MFLRKEILINIIYLYDSFRLEIFKNLKENLNWNIYRWLVIGIKF